VRLGIYLGKITVVIRHTATNHNEEGMEEGEQEIQISDGTVRTETARVRKGYIKESQ
jgi:hypothetical protein